MDATKGMEKEYSKLKIRLSIYHMALTFIFLVIILISGASVLLRNHVITWSKYFYIQAAIYLIIFRIIYDVFFVALDFYSSFIVEHKFSLSNQTLFDWIKHFLKKWLLSFALFILGPTAGITANLLSVTEYEFKTSV